MTFVDLNELSLFLAQTADPATGAEKPEAPFLLTLLPWLFLFGLIYFLFFRPISKARKEQENMAATVKPGAKVITVGGIVGIVTNVKEKTVMVRSGDGTKLEILKEKLASVETNDKDGNNKDEKAKDSSASDSAADDEAEEVDVEVTEDEAPTGNSGNPYNRSRRRRKGARR